MDLIKKLTSKNPSDYEPVAKSLLDNSDVGLFKKLVEQDDFLFDFIKNNVSKRIRFACNDQNYKNLFNFTEIYSDSYADMIAEVLHHFGEKPSFERFKELFFTGNNPQKAYALKYFMLTENEELIQFLPEIRALANSDFEPLSNNAVELLGKLEDDITKNEALIKLDSGDDFEQYDAVKFLVTFGAKDAVDKIIDTMKKSGLSENIACEVPFLIPLVELIETKSEEGFLVLANIINAIPEILPVSVVCDYDLGAAIDCAISKFPDSAAALVLKMAKDKFNELTSNEEYLFDSDKNTKDEVKAITGMLNKLKDGKLKSLIYDELYEGSNFVLFAIDYADETEELETLLESKNPTILLKVLSKLKEKGVLTETHKTVAFNNISNNDIKNVINAL